MFDAAGNIPAKLTAFESRWRENISSGELRRRYDALKDRQSLSLSEKMALSAARIREWYEAFNGRVAVSYSAGGDSSVLLWLVRQMYPHVQAVFCNTGLEYPEIVALAKRTPNTVIVRPKMPFQKVISQYGWPVVSKKTARGLSVLRNPTAYNQNIYRLYDKGINRFGNPVNGFQVPKRWRFLVHAPFPISDRCCAVMKKEPMSRYEKRSGNVQFVGTMAADSKAREKTYLQNGCNGFDMKRPRSAPLSFWTDQDILRCLKEFRIPYASVYGDIVKDGDRLKYTGLSSTGCVFCCFGLHLENNPNRFQRLKRTHPKLWRYCVDHMGLGSVLDYMRDFCPDRYLIRHFRYRPTDDLVQIGFDFEAANRQPSTDNRP